ISDWAIRNRYSSWRDNTHGCSRDPNLYWRLADVFAVGIHIKRTIGFELQSLCLEVVNFGNPQMLSKVDGRKQAQELGSADLVDKANVEVTVVDLGAGRNLHPVTVGGDVRQSGQQSGLVAADHVGFEIVRDRELNVRRFVRQ